jgi:hypothetical protein
MIAARARRWRCRSRTLRSAGHARHMSAARRELPLRASAINDPSLPLGRTLVAILPRPACTIADACCRTTPATPRSGPTALGWEYSAQERGAHWTPSCRGFSNRRCTLPRDNGALGDARGRTFTIAKIVAAPARRTGDARPALLALKIGARGRSDHRVRLERRLLTWGRQLSLGGPCDRDSPRRWLFHCCMDSHDHMDPRQC